MRPILVRPYSDDDYSALLTYDLPEEQAIYTSRPLQAVETLDKDRRIEPHVIYMENDLVGFFVLSPHSDGYTANTNAVLFKSFSIDIRHQRNGYALQALKLLPESVSQCFPEKNEIILTVHHTNDPAITLYLKAGFLDKGNRFNGECGEEWILHFDLK